MCRSRGIHLPQHVGEGQGWKGAMVDNEDAWAEVGKDCGAMAYTRVGWDNEALANNKNDQDATEEGDNKGGKVHNQS